MLDAFDIRGYVHFFPEGECYLWNQQIQPLQPGAFYLACRLKIPVVPITMVLHENRWFGRSSFSLCGRTVQVPPRVTITIGTPVHPHDFDPQDRAARANGLRARQQARAMGEHVRRLMQETVNRSGGCKAIYRGKMPRLFTPEAAPTDARQHHASAS